MAGGGSPRSDLILGLRAPEPSEDGEPPVEVLEVLDAEELTAFEDPESALSATIYAIECGEFVAEHGAVEGVRRLARFHPDILERELDRLLPKVLALIDSLRSAVARQALVCIEEVSRAMTASSLRSSVSEGTMVTRLCHRAGCDKAFLREAAQSALGAYVRVCGSREIFDTLLDVGRDQRAGLVQARAAEAAAVCLPLIDAEEAWAEKEEVINGVCACWRGRKPEARRAGKQMLRFLARTWGQASFRTVLSDVLPPTETQSALKVCGLRRSNGAPSPGVKPWKLPRPRVATEPVVIVLTSPKAPHHDGGI